MTNDSSRHLEANILSQLYLQLDLFFISRQINDEISDSIINKGDLDYKNVQSTLPYNERYKYMINRVIPNFDEKLKSFILLRTTDLDNNNTPLSDKDIAFIGSYLNYHDVVYSEELYDLRKLFDTYSNEIEINTSDIGSSISDTSSEFDLMSDGHKVDAFFYVVMTHPNLNSVTYQILKLLNKSNANGENSNKLQKEQKDNEMNTN